MIWTYINTTVWNSNLAFISIFIKSAICPFTEPGETGSYPRRLFIFFLNFNTIFPSTVRTSTWSLYFNITTERYVLFTDHEMIPARNAHAHDFLVNDEFLLSILRAFAHCKLQLLDIFSLYESSSPPYNQQFPAQHQTRPPTRREHLVICGLYFSINYATHAAPITQFYGPRVRKFNSFMTADDKRKNGTD